MSLYSSEGSDREKAIVLVLWVIKVNPSAFHKTLLQNILLKVQPKMNFCFGEINGAPQIHKSLAWIDPIAYLRKKGHVQTMN